MLECLETSEHLFPVRRQAVGYGSAAIGLIEQPSLNEATSMFGNGLQVAFETAAQIVKRNPLGTAYELKNADSAMVRHALEIPLQLLVRLTPRSGHTSCGYCLVHQPSTTFSHSQECRSISFVLY